MMRTAHIYDDRVEIRTAFLDGVDPDKAMHVTTTFTGNWADYSVDSLALLFGLGDCFRVTDHRDD